MNFLRASNGFSLLEIMLALGIATIVTTLIATTTFQIVRGNSAVNNKLLVVNDFQNASRWLYIDGEKAQSTDLIDGADPVGSMTLSWTTDSIGHQSEYYLLGTELIREKDGQQITAARNISDVYFSLSDQLINVTMTSTVGGGDLTKELTHLIYIRPTE